MTFQTTVSINGGFGVPGERYNDGPWRADSYILRSDVGVTNIIGAKAYTLVSPGVAKAGGNWFDDGTPFLGILGNPKVAPLQGTLAGGSLAPTLELPNESQADIISMGAMVVTLPALAAIGDLVIYNITTGALATIAPSVALPGGFTSAFATVTNFAVGSPGFLAVITLTPTSRAPV